MGCFLDVACMKMAFTDYYLFMLIFLNGLHNVICASKFFHIENDRGADCIMKYDMGGMPPLPPGYATSLKGG